MLGVLMDRDIEFGGLGIVRRNRRSVSILVLATAVAMAAAIYMLEIFVALLQTFIFTILSAMFIGSFLHPAH